MGRDSRYRTIGPGGLPCFSRGRPMGVLSFRGTGDRDAWGEREPVSPWDRSGTYPKAMAHHPPRASSCRSRCAKGSESCPPTMSGIVHPARVRQAAAASAVAGVWRPRVRPFRLAVASGGVECVRRARASRCVGVRFVLFVRRHQAASGSGLTVHQEASGPARPPPVHQAASGSRASFSTRSWPVPVMMACSRSGSGSSKSAPGGSPLCRRSRRVRCG